MNFTLCLFVLVVSAFGSSSETDDIFDETRIKLADTQVRSIEEGLIKLDFAFFLEIAQISARVTSIVTSRSWWSRLIFSEWTPPPLPDFALSLQALAAKSPERLRLAHERQVVLDQDGDVSDSEIDAHLNQTRADCNELRLIVAQMKVHLGRSIYERALISRIGLTLQETVDSIDEIIGVDEYGPGFFWYRLIPYL